MEEKWLPAEHTLTFRVELDPNEAEVRVSGREFAVYEVRLVYRRVADAVNEWEEPQVVLGVKPLGAGGWWGTFPQTQLDEIPPWLADIEARAQPANP